MLTADEMKAAMLRAGRIRGFDMLLDSFLDGTITDDIFAELLGPAWSLAEYPERVLDRSTWCRVFRRHGYRVDGARTDRPAEALTLYRGAPAEGRDGMSWTSSLSVARRFAHGALRGRSEGLVWTARVDPDRLLAAMTDRDEAEYVVDTDGLLIVELD